MPGSVEVADFTRATAAAQALLELFPMRALLFACATATLVACSPSSSPSPSAAPPAAPAAATDDAGAPADVACDAPTITFAKSSATITPSRDHHHTLVREVGGVPYLYVLGGEDEDFDIVHDDVQRAKIGADGSLGAFESAGKIPRGRAGAALAVVGDDVVLAGGVVQQPMFTDEILVARFDAQGRLDTWTAGGKLPSKVQHAAAVVVGREVYVFGGTLGASASDLSVKVTVGDDGTLGPVTKLTPLSTPRSHHVAFVDGGAVYLVGGLDKGPVGNPPSRSDAVRAQIQPDGTIGAWETVGALAHPLSVSAVQKVGCSYLFVGGLDDTVKNGPYSDQVLRGSLASDGSFRSEAPLDAKLDVARAHVHQTPVYKQFLYSVGGRGDDGSTLSSIAIGTIAATGGPHADSN